MHRLLAVLLLMLGVAPASAQSERLDALFQEGNQAYQAGNYVHALDAYRQILDAGYASVALYHNVGNAYVRRGEMGPAIQFYAKGLQLQPEHPKLVHNLQLARERAGRTGSVPVLQSGSQRLLGSLSPGVLAVFGWLLLGAGIGLAAYRTSPRRPDAWRRPRALGLVAGGLLVWSIGLGISSFQTPRRHAVVLPAEVPVHAAPADTATTVTTAREGMMINVERDRPGWFRIRLPDGAQGWVRTTSVGEV